MRDAAPFVLAFLKAHTLGGDTLTEWKNMDLGSSGRGGVGAGSQEYPAGNGLVLVKSRPIFHPLKAAIDTLESLRHKEAVPTLLAIARKDLQSLRMEAVEALPALDPEGTRADVAAVIAGSEWQADELLKVAIMANPEVGHGIAFELLRSAGGELKDRVERLLSPP